MNNDEKSYATRLGELILQLDKLAGDARIEISYRRGLGRPHLRIDFASGEGVSQYDFPVQYIPEPVSSLAESLIKRLVQKLPDNQPRIEPK